MCYVLFRCQHESLQSIRKSLLGALNLQTEPQLPAGGLEGVRKQWWSTFSSNAHRAMDTAGKFNPKFEEATVDPTVFQPNPSWIFLKSNPAKSLHCSTFAVPFLMSFQFQQSLGTLCHLMMETVRVN